MFDNTEEIGNVLGVSLGENVVQKAFSEVDAKTAKSILEETQEKELALVPHKTRSLGLVQLKLN